MCLDFALYEDCLLLGNLLFLVDDFDKGISRPPCFHQSLALAAASPGSEGLRLVTPMDGASAVLGLPKRDFSVCLVLSLP